MRFAFKIQSFSQATTVFLLTPGGWTNTWNSRYILIEILCNKN